jgi:putative glycosyltransferase (TIGR04348 family)
MARIVIVSPRKGKAVTGNSVTAGRWRGILESLGHGVTIAGELGRRPCDVLIALHATKSAASVKAASLRGDVAIVVALTGTDLYQDLLRLRRPQESLRLADRIVLLQPLGLRELSPAFRRKSVVIRQSVTMPKATGSRSGRTFDVIVLSNLRPVKDPLRAAYAARMLPGSSRVRVVHAGASLAPGWEERARAEMQRNPRYLWKGELPLGRARRLLAGGDLCVIGSRSEGGANVLSEAIVAGVPLLASDIPGNVGILGRAYPGYFPVGDTKALARLIHRAETDDNFYAGLRRRIVPLSGLFDPKKEQNAWRELLKSCVP